MSIKRPRSGYGSVKAAVQRCAAAGEAMDWAGYPTALYMVARRLGLRAERVGEGRYRFFERERDGERMEHL